MVVFQLRSVVVAGVLVDGSSHYRVLLFEGTVKVVYDVVVESGYSEARVIAFVELRVMSDFCQY